MEKTIKKELKTVLNAEIYDEMRFVFRPDQLENIIYKPEMLGEKKWQCCCGSVCEFEICPICGMEKHTVFSKVNPGYLAHHRKTRIARKRKAMQDQQAMMAAQIIKKNKTKKKNNEKTKKIGSLIAILVLCIAIIASVAILFGGNEMKKPSETTPSVTDQTQPNDTVDTGDTGDVTDDVTEPVETPEETEPTDTTPPETTPPEPIVVPSENVNKNPSTIKDGEWPKGASGNVSVGGLVYCAEEYDYVVLNGISVFDKNGTLVGLITSEPALAVTGNGNTVYYIDAENYIHRYDTELNRDVKFSIKASKIICFFDELYYTSPEENGLFTCSYDGYKTKIVTTLPVYALNNTADKLYFSTEESLAVITSKDGAVTTFCNDGARATSIFEITNCLFYTSADGKLKFFNPEKKTGFSVEYPIYNHDITHVVAFENRVYIKAVKPNSKAVQWYSTQWTPGTKLFNPAAFKATGITTEALYVSNNAIYDGNLNRKPVS